MMSPSLSSHLRMPQTILMHNYIHMHAHPVSASVVVFYIDSSILPLVFLISCHMPDSSYYPEIALGLFTIDI